MYTSDEKYEVILNSATDINMSNLIASGKVREVDSQVKELAQCNLNKLEIVTNRRVVHLEMNVEDKIDIVVK